MVYVIVAEFSPPGAMAELREWRQRHAEALAQIPDDAMRVDVGRATGGDFARMLIADEFASGIEP